jgi:glycyl-tRNA synthetase (class II)
MQDSTVTVRHRDTMQQDRIAATDLKDYFKKILATR